MSKLKKKLEECVRNPLSLYETASSHGLTCWVPDEMHLKLMYRARMGIELDLENPTTFNEKLQWLKLHDRNPLYTTLVDKYRVKQWVAERIGDQYVTPTYAAWDCAEDIDITYLPERFVLKTNNDSGGVAICRDRAEFDLAAAKAKLSKSLRRNYYWRTREWPYKDVRPIVFAEEYLEADDDSVGIPDYKIFCFDGEPKSLYVATGRANGDTKFDFYDIDFEHLPVENGHPNADAAPERPDCYEEMLKLARALSSGMSHVRVDFYDLKGSPRFGEMTFFHMGGFAPFEPPKYDELFGSWIKLPEDSGGGWLLVADGKPRLLARLMDETVGTSLTRGLTDYKVMCFGGEARCEFTCTGRVAGDLRVDFFDNDWNRLPFTRHYPNADVTPDAPMNLREMLTLAQKLSAGIPFVRVDFYESAGRLFFGEMTFYPGNGMEEFDPFEWDERLGSWIELAGAYDGKGRVSGDHLRALH